MSGLKQRDSSTTLRPAPANEPVGKIITTKFSVGSFGKRWSHCHQLANFLARFVSANEDDPERHSTLLSTFFNELIEAVYRNHAQQGDIKIEFERRSAGILVRLDVLIDAQSLGFYLRAVDLVRQPDPMGWYRNRLEHDVPDDDVNVLGLLELAVVYGSTLNLTTPADERSLHLAVEFPFAGVDDI